MHARGLALPLLITLGFFGLAADAAAQDRVMMQGFYWDVQPGGVWNDTLAARAAHLGWAGFDGIWLPPLSKGAASGFDVGYTPYDFFDLGAYDSCGGDNTQGQGGCIPTRYGTVEGLKQAVQILQHRGLEVYADIVLNHRSGGSLEPNVYSHWYTGGGSLHSHNDSTFTAFPLTHGSGRVAWPVGEGNEFFYPNSSNNPDNTFDFFSDSQLAGFHQMYVNPFAYDIALHDGAGNNLPFGDSLMVWGDWLTTKLNLDGYRFDFVKGIHPEYLKRWVDHGAMQGRFHVHELFDGSADRLKTYHAMVSGTTRSPAVFDFNLRFAYKDVLDHGHPIYRWQDAGLINQFGFPFDDIVTFIDNHDFDRLDYNWQINAPGHSPVVNNKMLAYAHMLTHPGYATVWWRDYYHYNLGEEIDQLIRIRKAFASGDYYALTRGETGDPFWPGANPSNPWDHLYVGQRNGDGPGRGLIVAINKHPSQWAEVWVTQQNGAWTNTTLKDLTGHGGGGTTQIFGDNRVRVWAPPNSYTIWVPQHYSLPDPGAPPPPDALDHSTIHFGNLQWPGEVTVEQGEEVAFFARVYAHGRTSGPAVDPGVETWIGYSTTDTDPAGWTDWVEAAFHADFGHLDEYSASLSLPPGTYYVASRLQLDGGDFRYGGFSQEGGGFWDGEQFASGVLVVEAPPTFTLSGTATLGGAPMSDVLVALTGEAIAPRLELTNAAGAFSFSGIEDGDYTVTPSLAGYAFAPLSRSVPVDGEGVGMLDFEATLLPLQLGPILASTDDPVPVGSSVSFVASFTDLGESGLVAASWDWGDGTAGPDTEGQISGTVSGNVTGEHTFTTAGVHTVTLAAATHAGASAEAVYAYVVVFDPSAGFVTGGGWIDSPQGAYPANPELTGKANFGFVARYRRGQSVPDGNTQFQFNAAGLSFRSSDYQWLVVAGSRAMFKGTGTINHSGSYGFMLSAVDGDAGGGGGEDRFRIKIWDPTAGDAVVYDNQLGDADDAPAATALGGGGVRIHSGGPGGNAAVGDDGETPTVFAIEAVYPNPFRHATVVRFALPDAVHARVIVFDALGREVARLADGEYHAGRHSVTLDAAGLASGVYVVQLRAGPFQQTHRLTLMR